MHERMGNGVVMYICRKTNESTYKETPSFKVVSLIEQSENISEAHGEPVVSEGAAESSSSSSRLILSLVELPLLANLLLGGHDVLHVVDGQRGHDSVEPPQVSVLGNVKILVILVLGKNVVPKLDELSLYGQTMLRGGYHATYGSS